MLKRSSAIIDDCLLEGFAFTIIDDLMIAGRSVYAIFP
jgi:hypothetical protein